MLKMEPIRKSQPSKEKFLSNLFLVKKMVELERLVINLKQSNTVIPYCHFKTECLQNLKYMLQKRD